MKTITINWEIKEKRTMPGSLSCYILVIINFTYLDLLYYENIV